MTFLRVFAWLSPIIFGVAVAYQTLKSVPPLQAKVAIHATKIALNDKKVALVERDIKHILDGIKDIKDVLKRRMP